MHNTQLSDVKTYCFVFISNYYNHLRANLTIIEVCDLRLIINGVFIIV